MPYQLANFVYPSDGKAWIITSWPGARTSSGYMDPPQAKASLYQFGTRLADETLR